MHARRSLLAALVAATAIALPAPVLADGGGTSHASVDPTGEHVMCGSLDLTIAGGQLAVTWHASQDAHGIYHLGGTNTPHGVTLTDGTGRTYVLAGASHFTATSTTSDPSEPITATDVDHFVVRGSSGQPLGRVQLVVHLSANGRFVAVDRGSCELVESGD